MKRMGPDSRGSITGAQTALLRRLINEAFSHLVGSVLDVHHLDTCSQRAASTEIDRLLALKARGWAKASGESWTVGGRVTVVVDGTPVEGRVLAAPARTDDDAWTMDRPAPHDAWIVEVADFGCAFAVLGTKAVAELTAAQVTFAVAQRTRG